MTTQSAPAAEPRAAGLPTITDYLKLVVERQDLTRDQASAAMEEIMSGRATDAQIAAFLTAMRMKGETVEELTGFAAVMRSKATRVPVGGSVSASLADTEREMLIDTCGTGGDATGTFNVSTATAFVVAGAGVKVAKHGNRSVSSLCGSADVVEALGVKIDLPAERVGRCIDEVGIGFLFAPLLHSAMKYVMLARRQMAIRTVFNILGPLTNPAGAQSQVLGVYDGRLVEPMAAVLKRLGTRRAFVVHGADRLDELSTTGPSQVGEIVGGEVRIYTVTPEDFGLPRSSISELQGGDKAENARIIRAILAGERGPRRDIVVMNAAAALVAGGKARDFAEGARLAAASIDEGRAMDRLERLVRLTNAEG
ncbi:MAG TPA: anthranilate phosphoribosyltransferase [Thermodesulfobacteriota bacterium]